ncbi:MAG: hypothetical protein EBR67_10630 [Proteobacteria bacterium]|nr:hypothetical protein [Pseudomonadota bacterium]
MNDGVSTAGFFPFGYVTNKLSTVSLADGRTASTYRSNPPALANFLNQAIITPVMTNREVGSNLASA